MANQLNKEQWLERRKTGVGGSDMAALLGVSPWRTAFNVWSDKTDDGPAVDLPSVRMRIGTALEPLAAEMYTEQTGRKVRKCNIQLEGSGHRIGNVDRLVYTEDGKVPWRRNAGVVTERALEIKTTSDLSEWDRVPDHYITQIQHYMGLMPTVKVVDVPVLFLTIGSFRIYQVERDDTMISNMAKVADTFWTKYVQTKTPPPPQDEDDLKAMFPRHEEGMKCIADEDVMAAYNEYIRLASIVKQAEDDLEKQKFIIQSAMKAAEVLETPDHRKLVSWKTGKDVEKVDWKAAFEELAEAYGDPDASRAVVGAHTTTRPGSRTFRLSSGK